MHEDSDYTSAITSEVMSAYISLLTATACFKHHWQYVMSLRSALARANHNYVSTSWRTQPESTEISMSIQDARVSGNVPFKHAHRLPHPTRSAVGTQYLRDCGELEINFITQSVMYLVLGKLTAKGRKG